MTLCSYLPAGHRSQAKFTDSSPFLTIPIVQMAYTPVPLCDITITLHVPIASCRYIAGEMSISRNTPQDLTIPVLTPRIFSCGVAESRIRCRCGSLTMTRHKFPSPSFPSGALIRRSLRMQYSSQPASSYPRGIMR